MERGSGLYWYEYVRQTEALIGAQEVDSNIQEGGVQILQVEVSVYEGLYGCSFGIQKE